MRVEGWEKLLDDYIQKMALRPFKWGKCDCLIFSSDWCKIATNIDPMSKKKAKDPDTIRGLYNSEESAKELIKQYRKSVRDIMDVHFKRLGVNFAKRGDIVLYKNAFGVVLGRGKVVLKTENGMISVNVSDCQLAWGVE
jgi:hypothetical protein